MGKKKKKKEVLTKGEQKLHNKVVDAIQKSTTSSAIVLKKGNETNTKALSHAKECPCSECGRKDISLPTLDHSTNCVCYKCKKDKSFGKGMSTTSYSPITYVPCHDGNVFVFKYQGISVYGGGNMKDSEPNKVDIVLDLDRNVRTISWEEDLPKDWSCRSRASSSTKILDLFIKDMHAPEHIDAAFWKLFWADLRKEAHKNDGKLSILVMCQGGHGRTGVVLTSLLMASAYNTVGIPTDVHVVKWLRDNYCDKAVESKRQSEYLTRIWNIRFIEGTKNSSSTSFNNGATKNNSNNNGSDVDSDDDPEIPTSDTKCITCSTKRTANNRVLFSADLKEFECDNCFGIRADKLEETEDADLETILKLEDARTDLTEDCEGAHCFDEYDEKTEIWSTVHTYTTGCEMVPKKGESLNGIPLNNMTDKQYERWASSLL